MLFSQWVVGISELQLTSTSEAGKGLPMSMNYQWVGHSVGCVLLYHRFSTLGELRIVDTPEAKQKIKKKIIINNCNFICSFKLAIIQKRLMCESVCFVYKGHSYCE